MNPLLQLETAFNVLRTSKMDHRRRQFKLGLLNRAIAQYRERVRDAYVQARSGEERFALRVTINRLQGLSGQVSELVQTDNESPP